MRTPRSLSHALRQCGIAAMMVCISLALVHHLSSAPKRGPYKRVKPNPSAQPGADLFSGDLFGGVLKGERPANLGALRSSNIPSTNLPDGGDPSPMPMGGGSGWSKVVSAQTIEDEIKRIKLEVDKDVTTPTAFNGLGHKKCRKNFSVLGMLFAIAGEYDGDVRWKEEAPAARDLFAKAGRNCKVGTTASYNEARLRKQDLADMVAGGRLQSGGDAPQQADWSQACERSQLMKRIEKANGRLRELTASAAAFKGDADDVRHEAEMMAAIAEVMQQDEMPDGIDEDYKAFCQTIKNAAREIVAAQKTGSVEPAGKAMGMINRACDDCHEIYRG